MNEDDYKSLIEQMLISDLSYPAALVRLIYRKAGVPLPDYLVPPNGQNMFIHKPYVDDYVSPYVDEALKLGKDLLNKAVSIATTMHEGQFDRGGNPYIEHPLRVMGRMGTLDLQIIAVLHDVVEDTPITLDQLSKDFPSFIIEAVDALTRREGESYTEFIRRCKHNKLAVKVKIADIIDNMNLNRIPNPTKKDLNRNDRYRKALNILRMKGSTCHS